MCWFVKNKIHVEDSNSQLESTLNIWKTLNWKAFSSALIIISLQKEYFQDDVYPDTTVTWEPSINAADWLNGGNNEQRKISLRPSDMKLRMYRSVWKIVACKLLFFRNIFSPRDSLKLSTNCGGYLQDKYSRATVKRLHVLVLFFLVIITSLLSPRAYYTIVFCSEWSTQSWSGEEISQSCWTGRVQNRWAEKGRGMLFVQINNILRTI
jgi:hypothetical protein